MLQATVEAFLHYVYHDALPEDFSVEQLAQLVHAATFFNAQVPTGVPRNWPGGRSSGLGFHWALGANRLLRASPSPPTASTSPPPRIARSPLVVHVTDPPP